MRNQKQFIEFLIVILSSIIALSAWPMNYFSAPVAYLICIVTRLLYFVGFLYYLSRTRNINYWKLLIKRPKKKDLLLLPLIIICFSNILTLPFSNYYYVGFKSGTLLLILTLTNLFLGVLVEETVFRFFMFDYFNLKEDAPHVILLISLLFGSIHLVNMNLRNPLPTLVQVVYSTTLGFILGVSYVHSWNLIYPIILHLCFNLINSFVYSLFVSDIGMWPYYLINIAVGLIVVLYTALIYYLPRRKNRESYY